MGQPLFSMVAPWPSGERVRGRGKTGLRLGCVFRLRSIEEAPRGATVTGVVENLGDVDPPAMTTMKAGLEEAGHRLSGAEAVGRLGCHIGPKCCYWGAQRAIDCPYRTLQDSTAAV
jgi:hypothetical protein